MLHSEAFNRQLSSCQVSHISALLHSTRLTTMVCPPENECYKSVIVPCLRTGTNQSERSKTRIAYEVDRADIIRNFQNPSKQGTVFLNRLSGVRLSPGPPLLPIHLHRVDSSRSNSKHALKQCSVIKVSYFLYALAGSHSYFSMSRRRRSSNPPSTLRLAADDHKVKLEKSGLKSWEKTLTVSSGERATVNASLQPQPNP